MRSTNIADLRNRLTQYLQEVRAGGEIGGEASWKGEVMPREAKLLETSQGSPARALFRLQGNIPPNWIRRPRSSRKSLEPDLRRAMQKVQRLRKTRPKARVAIRTAQRELTTVLKVWEVAYRKETFYNGLRALLEVSRQGKSQR